jgi:hypothetical protein
VEVISQFLRQQWGILHPAEFFVGFAVCTAVPFFLIVSLAMMTYRASSSPFPGWRFAKLGVAGSFLGTLGYSMVGAFLPFFTPDRMPELILHAMLIGNVLGFLGLLILLGSVLSDWRGFLLSPGQDDWAIGRLIVWRLPAIVIVISLFGISVANMFNAR